MNHFIMRKNQYISLTVCISHGECHLIMIEFTEIWIQFHIFQEVIHPSHVPFQAESKSVFLSISCNHRPCCRFLSDHHCSMISAENNGIQMFKEFNRFQVLVSSVFIRNPFSVFLTIVKVKHRGNRIHTKSVYMTLFNPVKSICDQEVLNLRAAIIVNLSSPVRMFSLSRICMLIYCSSVKIHQTMGIFREMCRYPVKNNADLILVEIIDHIFEILRCSVSGSRCIISGYLISPGTIKRMLGDSH